MQVKEIAIDLVQPYEKNAKKHPKKQVAQIAESIKAFGFNQPIVVDTNNVVIVGHGRLEAAKLLDMAAVPVLTLDLTEEQAASYRLADNKLNESDWDMKLVIEELKGMSLEMLDLTGFSRDLVVDADPEDDVVPGAPAVPKSKAGDVYDLGPHRLVCGDSTKAETYEKLLGGVLADMVFTDPPYNVNYSGRGKDTSRTIENDHMEATAFDSFLEGFFQAAAPRAKAGAGWYVFHSSSTQHQFSKAMEDAGLEVRTQLIWNKPTASMGWGDYRWKHEPCFYGGKKETKITFYGDRTNSSIIDFHKTEADLIAFIKREKRAEIEGKCTVWTMKRDPLSEYVHPTQKPVELITYALVNSSKAEDLVLDPFGGSGSTIIACIKTNRVARSIEMDPTFVDIIVQRFVNYTKGELSVKKNGQLDESWEVQV